MRNRKKKHNARHFKSRANLGAGDVPVRISIDREGVTVRRRNSPKKFFLPLEQAAQALAGAAMRFEAEEYMQHQRSKLMRVNPECPSA